VIEKKLDLLVDKLKSKEYLTYVSTPLPLIRVTFHYFPLCSHLWSSLYPLLST
jgi:hypothetical protein